MLQCTVTVTSTRQPREKNQKRATERATARKRERASEITDHRKKDERERETEKERKRERASTAEGERDTCGDQKRGKRSISQHNITFDSQQSLVPLEVVRAEGRMCWSVGCASRSGGGSRGSGQVAHRFKRPSTQVNQRTWSRARGSS